MARLGVAGNFQLAVTHDRQLQIDLVHHLRHETLTLVFCVARPPCLSFSMSLNVEC
jgi:hypothetical protein